MRLIEKVWFQRHPARFIIVPLLLPLSGLFWLISQLRCWCYQHGVFKQIKHNMPIVVVGNIGVGGNGKTPVVLWLIETLLAQGVRVGVISRGYGGKAPYYPYVVDQQSDASMVGDEPLMIYQRHHIPVVVGSGRNASIDKLIEIGVDIVVCDDGLQHYKMARDYEIIVVDGARLFGNGILLPAGPLRESQKRLNSVDCLIVNGATDASFVEQHQVMNMAMTLVADKVINLVTGETVTVGDFRLRWPRINACAGIGDPTRFFTTLATLNFDTNNCVPFVDHHEYHQNDFHVFEDALPLLMTEKDAVKCRSFAKENWWYLPVDASFSASTTNRMKKVLLGLVADNKQNKE